MTEQLPPPRIAQELGIREFRAKAGAIADDVHFRDQFAVVTKYDRPFLVVVSPDWYARACAALGEDPAPIPPATDREDGQS